MKNKVIGKWIARFVLFVVAFSILKFASGIIVAALLAASLVVFFESIGVF